MHMVDVAIVVGTALMANVIWGRFVDPWLDSRPRKAIFVEPNPFTKKDSK